jgi:WD40 repeat protein/serine/threonine protein kinase
MPAVDPNRVRDLFLAAADLPVAGQNDFLAGQCGKDTNLLAAVERLLAAHAEPASILDPSTTQFVERADNLSLTESFEAIPDRADQDTVLAGRYKLVELIGEGGMGSVWSARQTEPIKRMVAVKLIKPGMDSKAVLARFEAERQALSLMDHPNIARVLDAGTAPDNRPFFVMELVKGVPITKYCDGRKLSTRQRLELFVPVCHAIQHAHQKGIIHRDIKPSNVLVALYDDRAVPKVIDFGVAKATGQLLTEMTLNTGFGSVVGTLEYMSPEQATFNNLDIDTRSDVYALGVLLYELLTGSPPFRKRELEKAGLLEILRVVREVDPPRPSTKVSSAATLPTVAENRGTSPGTLRTLLRNEIDWIVMKALEKDRSRRYETANGLALDIKRHLSGEQVMAVPPSLAYQVHKFASKYRGPVIGTFLVLLALVCGVIGTTTGLVRAENARDAEVNQRRIAESAVEAEAKERRRAEELARISEVEKLRANDEAGKAQASMEGERIAVVKSQRLLGLTNVTEGIRLVDCGDVQLGLLRIAQAMKIAPNTPEVQEIARMQLTLNSRFTQSHLRLSVLVNRAGKVVPTAFSLDGRRVLSGIDEETAQIWDLESNKPISRPLVHMETISCSVFSPDGQKVVTGCTDGTLSFWKSETGELIAQHSLQGSIVAVAFTTKGARALTAVSDGTVQIWNADTGKAIVRLAGSNLSVRAAAFAPDASRVLVGGSDTFARLFDANKGTPVFLPLSSHTDSVEAVAYSADGHRLVTGGKDQTARVWSADSGKLMCRELQHPDEVSSVAVSQDGRFILTGCNDHMARLWKVDVPRPVLLTLVPNSGSVESVAFSSKGHITLVGSNEGLSQLWELPAGVSPAAQAVPMDPQLTALAFSPDGRRVATGFKDGKARIWSTDAKRFCSLTAHTGAVTVLAFSPDGRQVVTGGEDKFARVSDAETGKQLSASFTQDSQVRSAAFSPDGTMVAIGNSFGNALVWNSTSRNGSQFLKRLAHGGSVQTLAFSPDSQRIAIGGANKLVRIWELETEKEILPQLRHLDSVESLAFSSDGRLVLTGSKDGSVQVFAIGSAGSHARGPAHASAVKSAAFSPNGRWALTGSFDGVVRIWDSHSGIALSPRLPHSTPIFNAQFSADGRQVALGVLNKPPRLIDLPVDVPDNKSVDDYLRLAELHSGYRIDGSGRAIPLITGEFNSLWLSLRAKFPEEFRYPE